MKTSISILISIRAKSAKKMNRKLVGGPSDQPTDRQHTAKQIFPLRSPPFFKRGNKYCFYLEPFCLFFAMSVVRKNQSWIHRTCAFLLLYAIFGRIVMTFFICIIN